MDIFLKTHNLPGLNYEEIEYLSRPVTSKDIEPAIKNNPTEESPGPGALFMNSINKRNITILFKVFREVNIFILIL